METRLKLFGILFMLLLSIGLTAQLKLPSLISDNMVLQRNAEVKIWGWASAGEKVKVTFNGDAFSDKTDGTGKWQITLNDLPVGGPYQMIIKGKNDEIRLDNILVGDVWVSSGQSNMELPVRRVSWIYPNEIENSKNDFIRQFKVPQTYNFKEPLQDFGTGEWISANPATILDFSAVAWFFAQELYEKYKVPIGFINNAIGGSPAEAWMSEEALKQFPHYYHEMQMFKDDQLIQEIEASDRKRNQVWHSVLDQNDIGVRNGFAADTELATNHWTKMEVPGLWHQTELEHFNGSVWFTTEVDVPTGLSALPGMILLGCVVDADHVYINGQFVGSIGYQYPPRRYDIPENVIKPGKNRITVRVVSQQGTGGFVPDKPYGLVFNNDTIDLSGTWHYKKGSEMPALASQTFVRWKPGGLYNAMIAPMTNYTIKGVIWYQGESNTGRSEEYKTLFPAMIEDWRKSWDLGDFPFLYVQLANFMDAYDQPTESGWALLRQAQLEALKLPATAMAVTIDVGEWNDIHPLNKKDVGHRLVLAARSVAYGESDLTAFGPIYESYRIENNRIVLSFSNIGKGLVAKGTDHLNHFAVAGLDGKFKWGTTIIDNNKVIVWNDEIDNPVYVRYAWADNPEEANLFNEEGLPATPFEVKIQRDRD